MYNSASFHFAFPNTKPRQIADPETCVTASGSKMSLLGIFDIDLFIKGKRFTHCINVMDKLNDNIIGINFTSFIMMCKCGNIK